MSASRQQVVRFDSWVDPVFDERLARETGIDARVFAMPDSAAAAHAALRDAHVFHVSAAKDELPRHCLVGADLLVVGNVGLNTIAGRLLGSVPANVARKSKTDVLIVHTTN